MGLDAERLIARLGRWADLLVPVVMVGAALLLAFAVRTVVPSSRVSVIFVVAVLACGALGGLRAGWIAAALATVALHMLHVGLDFIPVMPTLDEAASMVIFFLAAAFGGFLAARLHASRAAAIRRAEMIEALREVERVVADLDDDTGVRELVVAAVDRRLPDLKLRLEPGRAKPPSAGRRQRVLMVEDAPVATLSWRRAAPDSDGFAALLAARMEDFVLAARMRIAERRLSVEQSRNLMLASVSHDFRTPLASIITATSTAIDFADELDRPTTLRLMTAARSEAERLDRLVNHILAALKQSPGVVAPATLEPFDVYAALKALGDRFNIRGERVQIEGASVRLSGDDVLFTQAFSNLIENALKHSPAGAPVRVRVARQGAGVEITVEDRGPGVADGDLARLFDPHFQADQDDPSGYGLGLAIARLNIEAMSGILEAARCDDGGLCMRAVFTQCVEEAGHESGQ